MNSNENVTSSTDEKQATSDIKQELNYRYDDVADIFAQVEELIDNVGSGKIKKWLYVRDDISSALTSLDNAIADLDRCS